MYHCHTVLRNIRFPPRRHTFGTTRQIETTAVCVLTTLRRSKGNFVLPAPMHKYVAIVLVAVLLAIVVSASSPKGSVFLETFVRLRRDVVERSNASKVTSWAEVTRPRDRSSASQRLAPRFQPAAIHQTFVILPSDGGCNETSITYNQCADYVQVMLNRQCTAQCTLQFGQGTYFLLAAAPIGWLLTLPASAFKVRRIRAATRL